MFFFGLPPMLLGLSKNVVAPVSDLKKCTFFWRIPHAPVNIPKKFEQHSLPLCLLTFITQSLTPPYRHIHAPPLHMPEPC